METAFANINIKALTTVQPEQPPRQSAVTVALQKLADTNTAQLSNVDALILTAAKMQPSEKCSQRKSPPPLINVSDL